MDAQALETEAQSAISGAATPAELEEARVRYLGRKSELAQALRGVRDRETGMTLNSLRDRLEAALASRREELERAELDRALTEDVVDVTLPGDELPLGHLHPITQARRQIEDAFLGLGYEIRDDREVETVEYNFDKLAFDPWHPARSHRATFFFDDDRLLRTETSPSQIHALEEREPPIYMVSIGRCYRRDDIDATHYPIFHQFEGLAVDRGLTLADLKGTLLHVMRAIFGPDRRVRFRTHYFPFTEPSMEPDVSCGICGGSGCRTCRYSGWIEMGGSGRGRPAGVRERRRRPGGVERLRLRLRDRARRAAEVRLPGHPRVLGGGPPGPDAVLMRVPVSWLREYVPLEMPLPELAERLSISTAEVEGIERRGVPDEDGNLGLFRVGRVLEAEKHPNADRLQLCRVDVGEGDAAADRLRRLELRRRRDGGGRAAGRAAPGRPAARAAQGSRRALGRDDPRRGRGRARHRPLRDHGARRRPSRERRSATCCRSSRRCCWSSRPATGPTCSRSTASRARSRRSTT